SRMSNSPTPPTPPPTPPAHKAAPDEIKVVAHSHLFYWWPVWLFGLIFALWTYADNFRMAIVSENSRIVKEPLAERETYRINVEGNRDRLLSDAKRVRPEAPDELVPGPRVSPRSWMAPLFLTILFLVILITNVPLRGLWSLIIIISIALLA